MQRLNAASSWAVAVQAAQGSAALAAVMKKARSLRLTLWHGT